MKKYISIEEFLKKDSYHKRKNLSRYLLEILCLTIIVISVGVILNWAYDNYKIKRINKNIEKDIDKISSVTEGTLVNQPENKNSNYYYYASFPFYEVNFSKLLNQNQDTVAYIHLPGTMINYPVVKTNDNKYYLKHSFDKKSNNAGWIFMDYRNSINALDDNTVIYGHARLDETLFGSLKNVLTTKWQKNKDNYVIFLSTLKENMIFQIFSIYTIKEENYYIKTQFNNNNEKKKWIDTMQERNISPTSAEVNINDKFLTLSTCQNRQGGRIVIHAKLIKKQSI